MPTSYLNYILHSPTNRVCTEIFCFELKKRSASSSKLKEQAVLLLLRRSLFQLSTANFCGLAAATEVWQNRSVLDQQTMDGHLLAKKLGLNKVEGCSDHGWTLVGKTIGSQQRMLHQRMRHLRTTSLNSSGAMTYLPPLRYRHRLYIYLQTC